MISLIKMRPQTGKRDIRPRARDRRETVREISHRQSSATVSVPVLDGITVL